MSPGLIDFDVHQELRNTDAELLPYVSTGWQDFVRGYEQMTGSAASIAHGVTTNPICRLYANNTLGYDRKDAIPADGSLAGSSRELMVEQLLDPFDVRYAILTGGELQTDAFTDVCAVGDLEPRRVHAHRLGPIPLGVALHDAEVFVFQAGCPHRGGPLSKGCIRG